MFENVGNACGIFRNGHKGNAKGFVGIVVFYGKGCAAKSVVLETIDRGVYFGDILFVDKGEVTVCVTLDKISHGQWCLKSFRGIKQQGNWALVGKGNIHFRLKGAGLWRKSDTGALFYKIKI